MNYEPALETYLAVWNERDAAKRLELLQSIVAPEVQLFDPLSHLHGAEMIAGFIGKIQQKIAFARLTYTTKIQKHDHGNWVRYGWGIWLVGQENPVSEGMDVVEFDDSGKVLQIVSFMGKLA
jgi:hypothetical protein